MLFLWTDKHYSDSRWKTHLDMYFMLFSVSKMGKSCYVSNIAFYDKVCILWRPCKVSTVLKVKTELAMIQTLFSVLCCFSLTCSCSVDLRNNFYSKLQTIQSKMKFKSKSKTQKSLVTGHRDRKQKEFLKLRMQFPSVSSKHIGNFLDILNVIRNDSLKQTIWTIYFALIIFSAYKTDAHHRKLSIY